MGRGHSPPRFEVSVDSSWHGVGCGWSQSGITAQDYRISFIWLVKLDKPWKLAYDAPPLRAGCCLGHETSWNCWSTYLQTDPYPVSRKQGLDIPMILWLRLFAEKIKTLTYIYKIGKAIMRSRQEVPLICEVTFCDDWCCSAREQQGYWSTGPVTDLGPDWRDPGSWIALKAGNIPGTCSVQLTFIFSTHGLPAVSLDSRLIHKAYLVLTLLVLTHFTGLAPDLDESW